MLTNDDLPQIDVPAGQPMTADWRDRHAQQRDDTADQRDDSADLRDSTADERDRLADHRDQVAERSEGATDSGMTASALHRSALARRASYDDRQRASQDRQAAATARLLAEDDRNAALVDRSASAEDRQSAAVDGATGVYRRDEGFAELERDIAPARRTTQSLVVAFVDVDHLKNINDSHGHAAGDAVLLAVTAALRDQIRSYDLIFRYGGDEFVCAMTGMTMADATRRLDLVNAALAAEPAGGSVTVGLAVLDAQDLPADVVARADEALYRERLPRQADAGARRRDSVAGSGP